jgi:hypothetical protein
MAAEVKVAQVQWAGESLMPQAQKMRLKVQRTMAQDR